MHRSYFRSAIIAGAMLAFTAGVGCSAISSFLGNTTQSATTATPQQANTLGDAELMFTVLAKNATIAVDTGTLSVDALRTLDDIRTRAHGYLLKLRAAHAAGENLNFAAFNAAFQEYLAWSSTHGVKNS